MAELRSVVVPLDGSNYATWKIQCRMALIKEDLWSIVEGTEIAPADADKLSKFLVRKNKALAIIVLAVNTKLLYLLGDPVDPNVVWNKLANQFQKKTWSNKLQLRRKLYSLRLKDGGSVQDHVKTMTEIFDELSIIGDPISEEDRVVHLLASLPESFSMMVTALEANAEVPKMEIVTERLLHEERKSCVQENVDRPSVKQENAFAAKKNKMFKCHHCGKPGHIKKNCWSLKNSGGNGSKHSPSNFKEKEKSNCAEVKGENVSLFAAHISSIDDGNLVNNSWIVDSGATCHMCNDKHLFTEYSNAEHVNVALGNGYTLKGVGYGKVVLNMLLPDGKMQKCTLSDVLYVPKLSFNLLSVCRVTKLGKMFQFDGNNCKIVDANENLIAVAEKKDNLYYLKCTLYDHKVNAVYKDGKPDENVWHRRYGHLGVENLKILAKENFVDGFDFVAEKGIDFCESCAYGKNKKTPFPCKPSEEKLVREPLDLIHSDVCGKINEKSFGNAEYFVTFIDDATRHVWVYFLKGKHEVFEKFKKWKSLVENQKGKKIKILRTDNGGEYTSNIFENFLSSEGIRHEYTIPKTPEQNSVSERMNRTLVEQVRSMLFDSGLPHKFWAEALSTACYLKNVSPARALKGMTPFQAFTGCKPNVKHLRIFGCVCYAHIPKDERKKLDYKSSKCIFLGYGSEVKAYRLYNLEKERVFHSRDVIFNERQSGLQKEEVDVNDKNVVIEFPHADEFDSLSGSDLDVNETPEPDLRRSVREKRAPHMFGEWVTAVCDTSPEPTNAKQALMGAEREYWKMAMQDEMDSIYENDVYDLVELPDGKNALNSRWVFKRKIASDGSIERYKARFVAKGCSQKYGEDYDEIFCPVVRFESVRTVIALAVQKGLKLYHMDVTSAFLNGTLTNEVYMKQPEGYVVKGKEHLVCKLKKSIYGLKQSPRCWNYSLDESLKKLGFVQTPGDPCIYVSSEGDPVVIAVYVDDIILACKSDKKRLEVHNFLERQYKLKDLGELEYFLGVKVVQDDIQGQIWIGQPTYTQNVLLKFGMDKCKSIETPVDPSQKLCKATDKCTLCDQALYQSAVGCLLYLSVKTRPDITFAVHNVAKYSAKPTIQHWKAVKRIFRYLKGTENFGIMYKDEGPSGFIGYSDADWGGDIDNRRSTSGYSFHLSGGVVSYSSRKQSCVALSTAEAEYMALASATQEAVWLRKLATDLHLDTKGPMLIYEDNQATIVMSKDPQYHGRSKHIDIKFHYVRDQCNDNVIQLKYCPTNDMIADIFTKGLSQDKFKRLRQMLGMCKM